MDTRTATGIVARLELRSFRLETVATYPSPLRSSITRQMTTSHVCMITEYDNGQASFTSKALFFSPIDSKAIMSPQVTGKGTLLSAQGSTKCFDSLPLRHWSREERLLVRVSGLAEG